MLDPHTDAEAGRLARLLPKKYRVISTLGSGGMGVVYHAVNEDLEIDVAIKIIRPRYVHDEVWLERFKQEARILTTLRHPLCVTLLDYGLLEGGIPYLTMDYCRGQTLKALIADQGKLAPTRAAHITMQVLEVLEAAHRLHIVHRDIKPENIMVDVAGGEDRIKVMDFGIAKLLDHDAALTASSPVGTPLYMSPERILNEPSVDGRADIYSVGAVLHEMLTGEPPFVARGARAVMEQHLRARVPGLASSDPLALTLHRLARRAMRKKPSQRFPTAKAFRSAIKEALLQAEQSALGDTWPRVPGAKSFVPAGRWAIAATMVLAAMAALTARHLFPGPCSGTGPVGPTPSSVPAPSNAPSSRPPSPAPTPTAHPTRPDDTASLDLELNEQDLYPHGLDHLPIAASTLHVHGPGPGKENEIRLDGHLVAHAGTEIDLALPIDEGTHRLTLIGRTGRAYRSREISIVVDRTPPTFPSIEIVRRPDGAVQISGTVTDTAPVRLTADRSPVRLQELQPHPGHRLEGLVTNAFTFIVHDPPQHLLLVATDEAGNTSTQDILLAPRSDSPPPTATPTEPR